MRKDYSIYITDMTLSWKNDLDAVIPNIMQAMFHPKLKCFYLITRDWGLYLCDLHGKILSRALISEYQMALPTPAGLAVVRHKGQLSLYPVPKPLLNSLSQWEFDDNLLSTIFRKKYMSK